MKAPTRKSEGFFVICQIVNEVILRPGTWDPMLAGGWASDRAA